MNRILDQFGQPATTATTAAAAPRGGISNRENRRQLAERGITARFDSQFTTDDNRRHWAMADAMSIDASASWMVRRVLRMRARYEYHNNSYLHGIAHTVGDYVIGKGPRLQMLTRNKALNRAIEKAWNEWAKEIGFARTLRNMRVARIYNGESFSLLRTNPNLNNPIKLDVFEVEADQVSSPLFGQYPSQYPDQFFDGVVLDPWGRPEKYHVLRQHPGAFGAFVIMGYEFDSWPARYVLHDFKRIRPGQQRGVPEVAPCLEDLAELRRFAKATVSAAEAIADFPIVIQSDAPADGDDADCPEAMDTIELRRRMGTVLPQGWKIGQAKPEQPTATYEMFVNAKLQEVGRCIGMPLMFITLDARQANMASAYIIIQPFAKGVQADRDLNQEPLCDRVFDEFLTEAIRVPGLLPGNLPDEFPHAWQWPKLGNHADPMKVANSRKIALQTGTGSIPEFYAEDGGDWQEGQEQAAASLGMSIVEYRKALRESLFATPGTPPQGTEDPEPDPVDPDESDEDSPPEDEEDTD